ncbi:unnamed protein product [Adineta ricciae]|uniref:Otopetrin n=1 Tax=Adineta ricciae TaxID=249248 RepID=A0A814HM42_ADIRI|nr:unnamed protein product [Adineta ricciae]
MLATPDTSAGYLRVPSDRNLHHSKPHRATSFTEQPIQHNEHTASVLSLPTTTHVCRKRSRSPTQWQSTASRVDGSRSLLENNDEHMMEDSRTIIVPDTIALKGLENSLSDEPFARKQHFPKHQTSHGYFSSNKKSNWTHLLFHNRSNDENSDVYKIFSILYGLVIFVGGVAFSISHAIIPAEEAENIKLLAEVYFTYLYWVSIFWIIFCMFDIVRHRRKIPINTSTINKMEIPHLPKSSVNLHLPGNAFMPMIAKEEPTRLSSTPYFNLQLFDDSDEFESNDENDRSNGNRRHGTVSTTKVNDDDDDGSPTLRHAHSKSQSLDDVSTKSSVVMRSRADTTRDFSTRRRALDPNAIQHLRTYVRHRKDSIVQRVIGYNYDDHSTAGGLYIRVGIGIFCLGTVIHSGLSILSNLENIPCVRWTAVMDDISRLLFSFIQFFFIFKHSNLIIRAHESLARLAVMHIVVTNLCVWFRMVVIETKLQITEMSSHEVSITAFSSITQPLNGTFKSAHNVHHGPSTNPTNCIQSIEDAVQMAALINVGYMKLKPLLYPCTIEFSLMSLTLFYLIWENIGKTFAYKMSDKASSKNVFMVNCHASIKGLFTGMIVFSCTVISIILYAVFRNKISDDPHFTATLAIHTADSHHQPHHRIYSRSAVITPPSHHRHHYHTFGTTTMASPLKPLPKTPTTILYSIAIVEIVNFFLLCVSLSATTWALFKIRKLQYKRTTSRFDDVLIVVSLTGTYLYTIFSAFALLNNKNHATIWIAYLKIVIVVLEFLEATVHAFFILVALRKRLNRTNKHQYPAREIITLLIMIDLSLWFEETTTTTKHEANPFQLAFYHVIPWSIIAAIATPLQIFFRFHASVCLSHVWENMYILPVFEPVAPHGL